MRPSVRHRQLLAALELCDGGVARQALSWINVVGGESRVDVHHKARRDIGRCLAVGADSEQRTLQCRCAGPALGEPENAGRGRRPHHLREAVDDVATWRDLVAERRAVTGETRRYPVHLQEDIPLADAGAPVVEREHGFAGAPLVDAAARLLPVVEEPILAAVEVACPEHEFAGRGCGAYRDAVIAAPLGTHRAAREVRRRRCDRIVDRQVGDDLCPGCGLNRIADLDDRQHAVDVRRRVSDSRCAVAGRIEIDTHRPEPALRAEEQRRLGSTGRRHGPALAVRRPEKCHDDRVVGEAAGAK